MPTPIDRSGTFRGLASELAVNETKNGYPQLVIRFGAIVVCSYEKGLPLEVDGDRDTMIINQADIVAVDDGRQELKVVEGGV